MTKINLYQLLQVISILLGAFISPLAQTFTPDRKVAREADEYMRSFVKTEGFSGSVLLARDGRSLFSKAYGLANIELDVPNTPQTLFRIASITKPFTATSIMMLQERGKLSVNDSFCKYLADCPSAWQSITIRNLLTHTSGLPRYNGPEYRKRAPLPVTHDEIIVRLKSKPLEFTPGEKFDYTDSGYYLLGMIIERLSGRSYDDFLQQNICVPLRMKHTGYHGARSIVRNRASGYSLLKDRSLLSSLYEDPSVRFAAGAIWSTTEDLLRFDTALHAGKLVSRKSLDEMSTPFKESYGYGLGISHDHKRRAIGHAGSVSGFTCDYVHYVTGGVTVIILSNKPGFGDLDTITTALTAIVFSEKYILPSEIRRRKSGRNSH